MFVTRQTLNHRTQICTDGADLHRLIFVLNCDLCGGHLYYSLIILKFPRIIPSSEKRNVCNPPKHKTTTTPEWVACSFRSQHFFTYYTIHLHRYLSGLTCGNQPNPCHQRS